MVWHCHCCGMIQSLAGELLHVAGVAKKKKKKKKKSEDLLVTLYILHNHILIVL